MEGFGAGGDFGGALNLFGGQFGGAAPVAANLGLGGAATGLDLGWGGMLDPDTMERLRRLREAAMANGGMPAPGTPPAAPPAAPVTPAATPPAPATPAPVIGAATGTEPYGPMRAEDKLAGVGLGDRIQNWFARNMGGDPSKGGGGLAGAGAALGRTGAGLAAPPSGAGALVPPGNPLPITRPQGRSSLPIKPGRMDARRGGQQRRRGILDE